MLDPLPRGGLGRLAMRSSAALFVVLMLVTGARAQNQAESSVRRFADSVGEMLYFLAWPTAKYERVKFGGFSAVDGGADIKIRLIGSSSFDDSELWTDLVLEIRNGKISDLHWGKNNAILFQPGETVSTYGQALAELNKQYALNHQAAAAPAPVDPSVLSLAAVCLSNPTQENMTYAIAWENGKVDKRTLDAGSALIYWTSASQPRFTLSFDDSFEPGYQSHELVLVARPADADATACADVVGFGFKIDGQRIGIEPIQWIAGFPHAFRPHVFRSSTEGQWVCETGYKWVSPNDSTSLDCIAASIGIVGIDLRDEDNSAYPLVAGVSKGSPAERAGLQPGFHIISVDRVAVQGRATAEILPLIRGAVGSAVLLGVARLDGSVGVVSITRY